MIPRSAPMMIAGAYNRGAMALDGSYETKLMRLLIGYFHVSLTQQIALMRHGKKFEDLAPAEKTEIQDHITQSVLAVADQLSESALATNPLPPTIN